jgi:hypothetical protein
MREYSENACFVTTCFIFFRWQCVDEIAGIASTIRLLKEPRVTNGFFQQVGPARLLPGTTPSSRTGRKRRSSLLISGRPAAHIDVRTPMRNKIAIVLLTASTSLPTLAVGGEPFLLLRSWHFSCPEKHVAALETILDAQSTEQRNEAIKRAIYSGACGRVSEASIQIVGVKQKRSPGGANYNCFRELDAFDQRDLGPFCAASLFVSSIDAEIKTRTGAYRVTREEETGIKADCIAGGKLIIFKQTRGWERMSLVFPKRLDPPTRKISQDRERALRDGCKGADYKE